MYLITSTSTFNFSKYKYSSKKIGKYFVKNSSTNTKYLNKLSQVQSSTSNATFMFHNGEGHSEENTKAAVLRLCLHVCGAGYLKKKTVKTSLFHQK